MNQHCGLKDRSWIVRVLINPIVRLYYNRGVSGKLAYGTLCYYEWPLVSSAGAPRVLIVTCTSWLFTSHPQNKPSLTYSLCLFKLNLSEALELYFYIIYLLLFLLCLKVEKTVC